MRTRVIYQGRVQGVGFRATAVAAAGRFLVTGWVRNEPDGAVLLEVQGEPAQVERFLDEVQRTLERYIRSSAVTPLPAANGERGFQVRY